MFTKIDMSQAYAQLELDEESKEITTINTPRGLFRYLRLPHGICSAPGIFQSTMEEILKGIPGVLLFLDDILITGSNNTQHRERVLQVLTRLQEANFQLNVNKCDWGMDQVTFLGFTIDKNGIRPTLDKCEAISQAPPPKDIK